MEDKLMYIPVDDKQNDTLSRLKKLMAEKIKHC